MHITVICSSCREYNKDPVLEINFRDGVIYYVCPFCKQESKISLKAETKPYPKTRRM